MHATSIGDYALLSDCQSTALISRNGSVDWYSPPRFDSPSVFARLLDEEGGHWSIRPAGDYEVERAYLDDTMVLRTEFRTEKGRVALTDALALGSGERGHDIGKRVPHVLLRRVEGLEGERVNLIGTLRVEGGNERLQYRVVEGPCRTGEVVGYLDALAGEAEDSRKETVVVLDNAPFHTAKAVKERRPVWEAKGLRLYYLPAYCPHLNLIEGVWRRVKGFLMPRRFYDSVSELKQAVLHALRLLGAVEIHIQLGDT